MRYLLLSILLGMSLGCKAQISFGTPAQNTEVEVWKYDSLSNIHPHRYDADIVTDMKMQYAHLVGQTICFLDVLERKPVIYTYGNGELNDWVEANAIRLHRLKIDFIEDNIFCVDEETGQHLSISEIDLNQNFVCMGFFEKATRLLKGKKIILLDNDIQMGFNFYDYKTRKPIDIEKGTEFLCSDVIVDTIDFTNIVEELWKIPHCSRVAMVLDRKDGEKVIAFVEASKIFERPLEKSSLQYNAFLVFENEYRKLFPKGN